jgi:hypothetical protein
MNGTIHRQAAWTRLRLAVSSVRGSRLESAPPSVGRSVRRPHAPPRWGRFFADSPGANDGKPAALQLKTQKDYILHALRESGAGIELRALRDRVIELGRDIPMSSFQPLISEMANVDETIVRKDGLVSLKPRRPEDSKWAKP